MTDTVLIMPNGSKWSPSTSTETIQCANCDNIVDTEAEAQSYASNGSCPDCGNSWTEKRSVVINVTTPQELVGS